VYVICDFSNISVNVSVPDSGQDLFNPNLNFNITYVSDPISPTKTNSLPGYGRNGLHRVRAHSYSQ